VSLKFSENVQIPTTRIAWIAAGRGAVDIGAPKHGTSNSVVTVRLAAELPTARYVRELARGVADSHVVSGALSFAVGHSAAR
jgi:methionine-rich copper-binding protein CopC